MIERLDYAPSPSDTLQDGEPEDINPSFRVKHDVSLVDLLDEQDRENPIASDRVSIYTTQYEQGTEYAVVFPSLYGFQFYERLKKISRRDPGYYDVTIDTRTIAEHANSDLAQRHANRLGPVWQASAPALGILHKIFQSKDMELHQEEHTMEADLRTLEALQNLSGKEFPEIATIKEQIIRVLQGEEPADINYLRKVFGIEDTEIANYIVSKTRRHGRTQKRVKKALKHIPPHIKTPFFLDYARGKVKNTEEDNPEPFSEDKLWQYAERAATVSSSHLVLKGRDNKYFIFPKPHLTHNVFSIENNGYRFTQRSKKHSVEVFVNEQGGIVLRPESMEQMREKLANLKEKNKDRYRVIPIVRVRINDNGIMGFVHNESGPPLNADIQEDIKQRVEQEGLSSHPVENDWISGVAGADLMIMAHPSSQKIEDDWSRIWRKDIIKYADAMGEEALPKDADQINGPVQATVIAFHAFARYPEHFKGFVGKVVEIAEEKAA